MKDENKTENLVLNDEEENKKKKDKEEENNRDKNSDKIKFKEENDKNKGKHQNAKNDNYYSLQEKESNYMNSFSYNQNSIEMLKKQQNFIQGYLRN